MSGRARTQMLRGSALATLALALIALAPVAAARASGVAIPARAASRARRFWTPARMARAKPLEVEGPGSGPVPAAAPAAGAPGRAGASANSADGAPGRVAARASSAASSGFAEVADPTAAEYRTNGAVFLEADGGFARCSGTAVSSANLSVVFTAGHCVNGGGSVGQWYRGRWIFVPGYRYGQRPFGVFAAKWLDSTRGWLDFGSENEDVGAAVVTRNERGQSLGAAVGGAGIAWGLSAHQLFAVHGYPVAPPFNGETQRLCAQAPFLGHDPESILANGPLNLAVACEVSGGASGGGWTIRGDVLNSVTDYVYPEDPGTDFGSYFGSEVARLYHRAQSIR